jgi:GNAT superfamily N-acetyltransferase
VEWHLDGYSISSERELVDREAVWAFLTASYWAPGVTREQVDRAIEHSIVFGLRAADGSQAGFARVITDFARIAWIGDLFVLEEHRGRGLGVWLVRTIVEHPELRGLSLILATADAHGLYERFGFVETEPGRMMRRPGAGG